VINKSVHLPLSLEQAFELFTNEISLWWPADRRHLNDPNSRLFLLSDGRFYERASSGAELDLGRVRVWDQPHRIVLDFFMGTDAAHPTEVEIRFVADDSGTRVSVEHRPQAGSPDVWDKRAAIFGRSWDAVLSALRDAAVTKIGP
jgi:Activator of Hsp90 ATPase homolog 1-like protein